MAVEGLDHYTVNVRDLAASVQFYDEVLGLKPGERPDLGFPGAWLYCGSRPIVHLVAGRSPGGMVNGAFDHVALGATDYAGTKGRLESRRVEFRSREIPGRRRQIFLRDPDGVTLELNFPMDE
jgi:catechol 2,3-dioxygenase-like lactoylglutathione lyase family enzyme